MHKYRVSCWEIKKAMVSMGDNVKVTGKQGFLDKTKIKAKKIENLTTEVPDCGCGEPEPPTKAEFMAQDVVRTGKVVYVKEDPTGFWFEMESSQSP